MFTFIKWFVTILIFLSGCPYFTILKETTFFCVVDENRAEIKKAKCPHFLPHTNFLPMFTNWLIHGDEKPRTLTWTIFPCASYIRFLTWEVSYLLGFFLDFSSCAAWLVSCPLALLEATPALEEAELPLAPHAAWLGFGACGPFQGIISLLFMSIIAAFCVLGTSAGSRVLAFLLASPFFALTF